MSRGILYYVWGNSLKYRLLLNRSIASARKLGYNFQVITDDSKYKKFRKRIGIFEKSPFDVTLLLDVDTEIRGSLRYGFDRAEKYGLACSIAPSVNAYNDMTNNSLKKTTPQDLTQYNCGVLFFSKKAKATFNLWSKYLLDYPESAKNDQPYFSRAVFETINPYVLSKAWNYRPHLRMHGILTGELKILHSKTDY